MLLWVLVAEATGDIGLDNKEEEMPHYLRKLDKDTGKVSMVPAPMPGQKPEPINLKAPSGTLLSDGGSTKGITCSVCDKTFKTAGIMASHFNRVHSDLLESGKKKKRKDTWRKYVKSGEEDELDS